MPSAVFYSVREVDCLVLLVCDIKGTYCLQCCVLVTLYTCSFGWDTQVSSNVSKYHFWWGSSSRSTMLWITLHLLLPYSQARNFSWLRNLILTRVFHQKSIATKVFCTKNWWLTSTVALEIWLIVIERVLCVWVCVCVCIWVLCVYMYGWVSSCRLFTCG